MPAKNEKRKEDLRKAQKAYYQRNREKILANAKSRYHEVVERKKAWYAANRESLKENCKEWRKANAEKLKNDRRLRRFNITHEQYQEMSAQQDGKCAVCKRDQSQFKRLLAVDHDHVTGKVRELLCGPCNSALGLLRESLETIDALRVYVLKHKERDGEHARSE